MFVCVVYVNILEINMIKPSSSSVDYFKFSVLCIVRLDSMVRWGKWEC